MFESRINTIYCKTIGFMENVTEDESGEAHMVTVLGIAVACGLAVAALKPLVEQAGTVFGNGIIQAVTAAGG